MSYAVNMWMDIRPDEIVLESYNLVDADGKIVRKTVRLMESEAQSKNYAYALNHSQLRLKKV